eukprot:XP_001710209.1 Hypothetical protein GL50803_6442 [Giardia lamblia ATCC 50803]
MCTSVLLGKQVDFAAVSNLLCLEQYSRIHRSMFSLLKRMHNSMAPYCDPMHRGISS